MDSRSAGSNLQMPHLTAVPVVCLTGHYEPEQVSMQLGVTCLSKPPAFPDDSQCG